MRKAMTYTRGNGGTRGSQHSLPFWRRLLLPMRLLVEQQMFSSWGVHTLQETEVLTTTMLLAPEVLLLQHFIPTPAEYLALQEAASLIRAAGRQVSWIYDLDDPRLFQHPRVFGLLPLMRLITVPTAFLAKEVETTFRQALQRVEVVPSTFDLSVFYAAQLRTTRPVSQQDQGRFVLGCFGRHTWMPLLPKLLTCLQTALSPEDLQRLLILTDQTDVARLCAPFVEVSCLGNDDLRFQDYPAQLARCHAGLLPREGQDGEDICWLWEYGAFSIPTLVARGSAYTRLFDSTTCGATVLEIDQPDAWAETLVDWMCTAEGKQQAKRLGEAGYAFALTQRVAIQVAQYARVYRESLPISGVAY